LTHEFRKSECWAVNWALDKGVGEHSRCRDCAAQAPRPMSLVCCRLVDDQDDPRVMRRTWMRVVVDLYGGTSDESVTVWVWTASAANKQGVETMHPSENSTRRIGPTRPAISSRTAKCETEKLNEARARPSHRWTTHGFKPDPRGHTPHIDLDIQCS